MPRGPAAGRARRSAGPAAGTGGQGQGQEAAPASEQLTADTPRTTEGATFIAPAGWSIRVRPGDDPDAPAAGSRIARADVHADAADAAVAVAWAAYNPPKYGALKRTAPQDDRGRWQAHAGDARRPARVHLRRELTPVGDLARGAGDLVGGMR